MSTVPILDLSTQVKPPSTFTVDEEEYQLLGLEHLSPEDEAKATAAFSRFAQILRKLDDAANDVDAAKLAKALRGRRVKLIAMLTTVPTDVADKLPISAQTKLFNAIRKETGLDQTAADLDPDDVAVDDITDDEPDADLT